MSDTDLQTEEPNLFEYLASVPAVAALIGDRIYAGRIPQSVRGKTAPVMDCVVFQRTGDVRGVDFCATDEVVAADYQIDCYSPDDVKVLKVARAVRRALVDYKGLMGAIRVQRVFINSSFDGQEEEPGLCRRTQLYTIWYVEPES